MSVPKLRFKGFSEEWQYGKLGSFSNLITKGTTPKKFSEQGIKFIKIECFKENKIDIAKCLFVDEKIHNKELKRSILKENDILFAIAGATIGKVNVVKQEILPANTNQALAIVRLKDVCNNDFILNVLKSEIMQKYIRDSISVGAQPNLNLEQMNNFSFHFPTLKEQEKIASFFTIIDQKLNLLKEKKEKLELYKKGVMQQIFSQKLRFKDENGNDFAEWEEKKVKDIFTITRGNVLAMPLVSETKTDNNLYPVYSSQTKKNGLSGYYSKYLFEDCITWTTDGAGAGDVNFRDGKFYCTNVCGVLISDKGYANGFVSEILNSVSRKYVSYVGNPKLMNNVMAEIKISIPKSIIEQQKIADFLSSLDTKINLVSTQIEKTELWKKGLLQQMFV